MFNDYHFITEWQVDGTMQEVWDILTDGEALPRWWPAVYLDVKEVERGDEKGIGRTISLYTKGWLPYTLRWKARLTEIDEPNTFTLEAIGDFVGRGIWTLKQVGSKVHITYDWQIHAEKPLLKMLSPLLKLIFGANHRWAMRTGEESLPLELQRRRATTDAERTKIPAPPPPTFVRR